MAGGRAVQPPAPPTGAMLLQPGDRGGGFSTTESSPRRLAGARPPQAPRPRGSRKPGGPGEAELEACPLPASGPAGRGARRVVQGWLHPGMGLQGLVRLRFWSRGAPDKPVQRGPDSEEISGSPRPHPTPSPSFSRLSLRDASRSPFHQPTTCLLAPSRANNTGSAATPSALAFAGRLWGGDSPCHGALSPPLTSGPATAPRVRLDPARSSGRVSAVQPGAASSAEGAPRAPLCRNPGAARTGRRRACHRAADGWGRARGRAGLW